MDPGCTLCDAITAANTDSATGGCSAGSGADATVLVINATITLTVVDNATHGANVLPLVTFVITIQGNGTTIERCVADGQFGRSNRSRGVPNVPRSAWRRPHAR